MRVKGIQGFLHHHPDATRMVDIPSELVTHPEYIGTKCYCQREWVIVESSIPRRGLSVTCGKSTCKGEMQAVKVVPRDSLGKVKRAIPRRQIALVKIVES